MMVSYLKFIREDQGRLTQAGLDFGALSSIILGPEDKDVPACMTAPGWARVFIAREYRAAGFTFRALDQPAMQALNPVDGKPARCAHTFITDMPDGNPAIFALFTGGPVFGLAFTGLAGRVTHIYVPRLDCVVYDLDHHRAPAVYAVFQKHLEVLVMPPVFRKADAPRIGVVRMVRNYAHEVMNSLSGLQRLVDSGRTAALDEIWMPCAGFFGQVDALFPELASKLRHAEDAQLRTKVTARGSIFSIGSNMVTAGLSARILRHARRRYPVEPAGAGRWPLVAFTLRAVSRRCINLVDVMGDICTELQADYPGLGIILDGWASAETDPRPVPRTETDLCELVLSRLPPGLVVANLVGMPILKSIVLLRNIDAYVAHIGTLQHKLGWFSDARGIVHGPRAMLGKMDSGAYSSELGFAPQYADEDVIRDIPSAPPRGAAASDYEITDASSIVMMIKDILRDVRDGRKIIAKACV
jgi:hypothetical protein